MHSTKKSHNTNTHCLVFCPGYFLIRPYINRPSKKIIFAQLCVDVFFIN